MTEHETDANGADAATDADDATREPVWLSRQQAADHLGVSLRMLHYLRVRGKITAEKNDQTRQVRFDLAEVERLRVARGSAWVGGS